MNKSVTLISVVVTTVVLVTLAGVVYAYKGLMAPKVTSIQPIGPKAVAFPIIVIIGFRIKTPSLIIFSILIAIMVLITHQKNIERLLRREESKAKLIKKKKRKSAKTETE